MKKRIVALILTVVMSLLALTSCGGFDFAEEDLMAYVEFDVNEFNKALQNILIEDGDFTADEATRTKIVESTIYNAVANKILNNVTVKDQYKTGKITSGDAIYFVYYAVDADGNEYFFTEMDKTSVTNANTKENHTVKLGDYFYTATSSTKDDEKFLQLVIDNVLADVNIEDYLYSTLTKTEIENAAIADLKETNPDATDEEKTAAKTEALTVKEGDTICISYTREYTTKEGVKYTETATYHVIDIKSGDPLAELFLAEGNTALVGSNLANEANKFEYEAEVNGETVTYSYSNVNIRWKVENKGQAIATFKYTPFTSETKKTPSSVYLKDNTVDLKDKELTYYVYPVYAVDLPSYSEITADQILYHVYGSNLKSSSLNVLSNNDYKYEGKTVGDLLGDVTKIFNPSTENNEYYKEGTKLAELNKAYNDAVTTGGSSPTTEQKADIATKKAALNAEQNVELEKLTKKIASATKSNGDKIDSVIKEDYRENIYHGLADAYNSHITTAVDKAVMDLINNSVVIKSYPEKLVKEFKDHLYESYEYEFYKGDFDKVTTNYAYYGGDLNKYLVATLGLNDITELDSVLETKAKAYIDPMIKIHVIAQQLAPQALEVMSSYIESDIAGGMYLNANGENDADTLKTVRSWADKFVVNDAYMKHYKKIVGSAVYRDEINTYGELNLRTAKQFEVLFYYLTCNDATYNAETGHIDPAFTDGKIAYRTIKYDFK